MSLSIPSASGVPTATTDLGHAVHELVVGRIDLDEFIRRFLASKVYTLCPVRPGPFVMSRKDGTAIAPVWSRARALRQVMGGCQLQASMGADLVAQLPAGVGVLIDDGMPYPIALTSSALHGHGCAS